MLKMRPVFDKAGFTIVGIFLFLVRDNTVICRMNICFEKGKNCRMHIKNSRKIKGESGGFYAPIYAPKRRK